MKEFGMVLLFLAFCVGIFSKEINTELHKRVDTVQVDK